MIEILNDLTNYQKVLVLIGFFSTLLLVIFVIISILGFGDIDIDIEHDIDTDLEFDTDLELKFFSIKALIIFLAIFSCSSLFFIELNLNVILNIFLSITIALGVLFQIGKLLKLMNKLKEEKNFNPDDLIGTSAKTTLNIKAQSKGKIEIEFKSGGFTEYFAINNSNVDIKRGKMVYIIDYLDGIYHIVPI